MLLACSYLHHSLNILKARSKFGIIIESAEPREPHHFALLFGYGASAINPYMVNEIDCLSFIIIEIIIMICFSGIFINFISSGSEVILIVSNAFDMFSNS